MTAAEPTRDMNRALLDWYGAHGRDLVFRRTRDPYAVLVAEVMLQQTQVARVEPAWRAFVARFPTVEALAGASLAEVIRAWGGLGYNARAVRLGRAAAAIVERHGGRVPDDVASLEALPGVGRYTARAVAATAHGRPVAPLDTNVGRVVRRVTGLDGARDPDLQRRADALVDHDRPADWTHAMMDLGSAICRGRDPRCSECPLRADCRSAPVALHGLRRQRRADGTMPFPATRRWLRGRIMERLREEQEGRWITFRGPLGRHGRAQVQAALGQLAVEGLVELDARGRARLPQTRPQAPARVGGPWTAR